MTPRKPILAGNWKMHFTLQEAHELTKALVQGGAANRDDREVFLFAPFPYLMAVAADVLKKDIVVGSQDCYVGPGGEQKGAFTAAVSPMMIRSVGAQWTLVGHSERRSVFGDSDAVVAQKRQVALAEGLGVMLCVGETLEERDAGQTLAVVERQLTEGTKGLMPADLARFAIAYEPVWAIGTGRTATPAQAQEIHGQIRQWVARTYGPDAAEAMRILYGGSVKPSNVAELMSQPDIDGALVGGASLVADSFLSIINFDRQ